MKALEFDENGDRVINGDSEDVTNLQENIDAQLSEMFEQFGGDENDAQFKINIYRVQEGRGELGYCFSCVPSELPILDKIRDDYGPGKYEIRVYEKTDKTRLKKRTKLVIEKAQKKPVVAVPAQQNTGELKEVITAMMNMQQKSMEQFQQLMLARQSVQPPAAPAIDPMQMITGMVTAMSQLNGMMPRPEASGMDQFIKGIEVAKELAVESSGGEKGMADVLINMAKEFGQPIMQMVNKMDSMPAQPVQPGSQSPTPQLPPQPVQPTQENDPMFMLKMQLKMLVNKAAANADPALYADLILDSMPEAQIREFLGQPNLREFLTELNPAVLNYWPWFEQLQAEVLAGLTPAPEGSNNLPHESPEPISTEPDAIPDTNPSENTPEDTAGQGDAASDT